ncbi:MAG TPA: TetR/AcrR family transcriptional regulator [Pseudonocardiaceae bacterium]|jgi:AcrR family transcriptional regulator|nr:TetR/AcrR family transcriptional regulator [Pseudonocardiaceae bacterium]
MEPPAAVGLASLRTTNRRKRRIDEDRRAQLLGHIREIVLDEGFADLTVDQLAARLQCSKSTLYAISSSKEFLVTTAVKHFFRDAAAAVERRVAGVADPSERIAAYLAAVGDQMRRMSPACYQDMVVQDSTREIYAINSAAAARRVREFIREGVAEGYFRALHAEFVGEAVSLLIDGIQHGQLLIRTGLSSGDAYGELSDLVLAALTNRS